ncbi:hypothetical protein [Intestinimonas butyriciproducens]|uniref:hypothetical protein n=1 Tax=Intestinimonas butyriciproducens TaxID=1297617 RepID=UPI001402051B|nr:hypothetical protein [Intestinimonas butyriciproducens]MBU5231023.1 hypothetical protein [Intestinimonas butyriciproducens]
MEHLKINGKGAENFLSALAVPVAFSMEFVFYFAPFSLECQDVLPKKEPLPPTFQQVYKTSSSRRAHAVTSSKIPSVGLTVLQPRGNILANQSFPAASESPCAQ